VKKKYKWESIQSKQARNIYGTRIKNRIKGTLCPGARTGRLQQRLLRDRPHDSASVEAVRAAAEHVVQSELRLVVGRHATQLVNDAIQAQHRRLYVLEHYVQLHQSHNNRQMSTALHAAAAVARQLTDTASSTECSPALCPTASVTQQQTHVNCVTILAAVAAVARRLTE